MLDTAIVTERCICGSAFWPGRWDHNSSIFTDEFRNWLASFNCFIFRAEGFLVPAGKAMAWHIDSTDIVGAKDLDPNLTTKINFMWGDNLTKCFMEYGELIDPRKGITVTKNNRKRLTYVYDPTKMKVTERFSLEHTVLINRGVAHRINNESDTDWYCLSCIIQSIETNEAVLFADAVKIFDSVCMG
jgi:hypothetical protein